MRRELPLALCVLALASALVLAQYHLLASPLVGVDDANIFFTYGRNLIAGQGFVYSVGGERVEGFTSLLWVLACAAALALSSQPELWLLALNVLFAAAAVSGVASFVARDALAQGRGARAPAFACLGAPGQGPGQPPSLASGSLRASLAAMLALAWAFGAPSFLAWTTLSLMDTGVYCAVLTLGSLSAARAAGAAGREGPRPALAVAAWVALAQLARPEGLALGLCWVASLALASGLLARSARAAWRCAGAPALTWLLVAGALVAGRLAYFGYPLPNTFYAKVSPSLGYVLAQGLVYLASFARMQPPALLALAAAVACGVQSVARLRSEPEPAPGDLEVRARAAEWLAISAASLVGVAIPVVEGGDHFTMFRAFQPVWPLLCAPMLSYAPPLLASLARSRAGAVAAAGLALGAFGALLCANRPLWSEVAQLGRFKNEFALAQSGRTLGELLNRIQGGEPRASLGVTTAGGIGFGYRGPVVDLLGLNNVVMGHSPGERRGLTGHAAFSQEVFYQLEPDLVFPDGTLGLDPGPFTRSLRPLSFENRVLGGLLRSERFHRHYLPVLLGRGDLARPGQLNVAAWCRRDAIEKLRASGASVVLVQIERGR